jgi:hypothetical protein
MVEVIGDRRGLDGIVTFTDQYVEATAEAAEILNLPTDPSLAMVQAHRKHEMRMWSTTPMSRWYTQTPWNNLTERKSLRPCGFPWLSILAVV